ncbi:MAG TPA: hypothetical protein VIU61_16670 [Kofleriaceae bacterium]
MALRIIVVLMLASSVALAQPGQPTTERLREGNAAAAAGDWARVTQLVSPLLQGQLSATDLAEAHRLAGIAAYYQQRTGEAEAHFLEYLKIELDGRLDPALYQPEVVTFFNDVRTRNSGMLRARRPKTRRYFVLNLIPPAGQIQNGERTKALVIGGLIAAFAIGNVSTYFVLRSWCDEVTGSNGQSVTCDSASASRTSRMRAINVATGIGLLVTYAYGVYDGVTGYRRRAREQQPFIAPVAGGGVVGLSGSF